MIKLDFNNIRNDTLKVYTYYWYGAVVFTERDELVPECFNTPEIITAKFMRVQNNSKIGA